MAHFYAGCIQTGLIFNNFLQREPLENASKKTYFVFSATRFNRYAAISYQRYVSKTKIKIEKSFFVADLGVNLTKKKFDNRSTLPLSTESRTYNLLSCQRSWTA